MGAPAQRMVFSVEMHPPINHYVGCTMCCNVQSTFDLNPGAFISWDIRKTCRHHAALHSLCSNCFSQGQPRRLKYPEQNKWSHHEPRPSSKLNEFRPSRTLEAWWLQSLPIFTKDTSFWLRSMIKGGKAVIPESSFVISQGERFAVLWIHCVGHVEATFFVSIRIKHLILGTSRPDISMTLWQIVQNLLDFLPQIGCWNRCLSRKTKSRLKN